MFEFHNQLKPIVLFGHDLWFQLILDIDLVT